MNRRYPVVMRGDHLDLTETGHLMWMRDNNPDGWDTETWRAFSERLAKDPRFASRCQHAKKNGQPRPHPTADGWIPSKDFDPIAALAQKR